MQYPLSYSDPPEYNDVMRTQKNNKMKHMSKDKFRLIYKNFIRGEVQTPEEKEQWEIDYSWADKKFEPYVLYISLLLFLHV